MNGNCYEIPSCDNVNCGTGFKCEKGQCIVNTDPPAPEVCNSNSDCQADEECISGDCKKVVDECANVNCEFSLDCLYGQCYRRYDYFCSTIDHKLERY